MADPAPRLERLALIALLILAFVPRVRDIDRGFDRGFEGYQGAFFAIAAVNYERLGVNASGGYPVLNIDLPASSQDWFLYANHSPLTPLLAWAGMKVMGPPGWSETWREGQSPAKMEAPIRIPFLLLHMAGLLALWWVARVAFGKQVALLSLALVAALPVSALYGTLVNYETPSLPCALLAVGASGMYARERKRRWLLLAGFAFLCACSFTFAPAFFLPFLVLGLLWNRRWPEAMALGVVGGLACLTPLLVHDHSARKALAQVGQAPASIWQRAEELLGPLFSGEVTVPHWLSLQVQHALAAQGPVLLLAAGCGAVLCFVRAVSKRRNERLRQFEWPQNPTPDVDLALPMLAGGLLYLFAFYKHTAEEQWSFQLYLVPGVVLCAARCLHGISLPLQRLRGGIAPLVLVAGTVMLLGLARFEGWRKKVRGPQVPLPASIGLELQQLLPVGAYGLHPSVLGLTPASTWYSWRSLYPVSDSHDPSIQILSDRLGLQDSPRFMLLPKQSSPALQETLQALRSTLGTPTGASDNWECWSL
ncbi:MAG: hypothetical protein ACI9F9_001798 [Candidatus Paceibacteria bacterium]|jgi:hypothetical protein